MIVPPARPYDALMPVTRYSKQKMYISVAHQNLLSPTEVIQGTEFTMTKLVMWSSQHQAFFPAGFAPLFAVRSGFINLRRPHDEQFVEFAFHEAGVDSVDALKDAYGKVSIAFARGTEPGAFMAWVHPTHEYQAPAVQEEMQEEHPSASTEVINADEEEEVGWGGMEGYEVAPAEEVPMDPNARLRDIGQTDHTQEQTIRDQAETIRQQEHSLKNQDIYIQELQERIRLSNPASEETAARIQFLEREIQRISAKYDEREAKWRAHVDKLELRYRRH